MNQSKTSKLIAIWFVVGFLAVAYFQICNHQPTCNPVFFPPEHPQAGQLMMYSGMTRDASVTYAPIIAGEREVTDWHSALYMYECRAALWCTRLLSIPSNGVRIQIAVYYLHLGVFFAYILILLYHAVNKFPFLIMLIVPICLSFFFMYEWMPLGLDFFFFIHFSTMCCTLAILPVLKTKHMRAMAWIIIAITLFHAVNFRKNAILLVPMVACIFVYGRQRLHIKNKQLLWKWIIASLVFSLVSVKLVSWTLPVQYTNPTTPMLSSDLRIAAVLRGEQEQFRNEVLQYGGDVDRLKHPYKDSLTAYWGGELRGKSGGQIPQGYEIYMEHWKKHPGSMMMSRFIQTIEFYCGGLFPNGQKIIERIYPALKSNPKAWCFLKRLPKDVMYGRIVILIAGFVLCCSAVCNRLKHGHWKQSFDKPIAVSCAAALIYAGSFAIVPPTADTRYLAPSLFIIWNACWIWLAFTIYSIERKDASIECLAPAQDNERS